MKPTTDAESGSGRTQPWGFGWRVWWERIIHGAMSFCVMVSIMTTVGVVLILCRNASLFFSPKYIYSNNKAKVFRVKDDLNDGRIVTEQANGKRHIFAILGLQREHERAEIRVKEGQLVAKGDVLAIEPGITFTEFLTARDWKPLFHPAEFGILPLICGTTIVAVGAGLFAIPLGLGTAIYLSEYASPLVRSTVKPMLELLAGIPSVVYGFVGLMAVAPVIQRVFNLNGIHSALSGCIVVGIMILPLIVSLSEDVLRAVPKALREAAYALGATKYDVTAKVVVPAAFSGIMASFLIAISRAIGETMAVALACGAQPKLTLNPLEAAQTMTSFIAQTSKGDAPVGDISYHTLFAVGLTLFVFTMTMNLIAQFILTRTRAQYE